METREGSIEILNDLIQINRERTEGYKNASYHASEYELKSLFCQMADESRTFITELSKAMLRLFGPSFLEEVIGPGKIQQMWKKVKSRFFAQPSTPYLETCESGEAAVLNAYSIAQTDSNEPLLKELVSRHEELLRTSYEVIRAYKQAYSRDSKKFRSPPNTFPQATSNFGAMTK